MSSKLPNLANAFLNEMESKSNSSTDFLQSILEVLEEKNDPEPREIQLVSDIYQYLEKYSLLKENLRNYAIRNYNTHNTGNKLSELLDDNNNNYIK